MIYLCFQVALQEVEYHKLLNHPNIVECVDSDLVGTADIVGNHTSQVLLVLPYCQVSIIPFEFDFQKLEIFSICSITLVSLNQDY